jgi:aerotolerance regulator-like protein/VWA domain-containing protein
VRGSPGVLTFLTPMFLAGAAATAVPIVLHLLKREPEPRVKFAAVRLLKNAPVEHTESHRLRELLLLALRVATLVLLALAFARPFFATGAAAASSGVTIVALDTSFSMSAPGRFERAQQLAKEAVGRTPAGDLVGVVTFDEDAAIVARPAADRVIATSAIEQASPGFGATRYRAALATATQALLMTPGRRASIILVTDLQENGWDQGDRAAVPDGARVDLVDVGEAPPNLAITGVRAFADRVVATIHNSGPRARDVKARLRLDGRPGGEAAASAAPGQSADVTFPGAPRGAVAEVRLDDPDGPAADNVRYLVLQGARRQTVLVVSGGSAGRDAFYVQHALGAGETTARGYDVALMSGAQLSTPAAGAGTDLSNYAAVLLVSTRGLERRGREALASYVQRGGGLLLAAGPDVDGDVAADVLGGGSALRIVHVPDPRGEPRTLAPVDARHPIFRPFASSSATLALVRFRDAARIAADGCQTLARFTTGDRALLECAVGNGRALVLASDLDNRWNDFPLHASFVPFLHECIRYLASSRALTTDYLVGDAPAGVPRRPGVHTVAAPSGGQARQVAVNVDPRESVSARLTADEFQAAITQMKDADRPTGRVEARQQEDNQHLWQYAIALMVITLTVEGLIAARTA